MAALRFPLAGLLIVIAVALLIPSVQRFLDQYFTNARIEFGFAEGNPLQRVTLVVFSGMLIFFALTVVR